MILFMGGKERKNIPDHREAIEGEVFDPHHFYAAYIFDKAENRRVDVNTLIEHALRLGYPVRYWWLSDAMDLQGYPDRLIVCVHHPSRSEDAGMDLYKALRAAQVEWDDLDAAALEEYSGFGRPVDNISKVALPGGNPLFPEGK